jgi:hypothetical protein
VTAIQDTRARGIQVLGYVTTSYAGRALVDVKADVDRWRAWYPLDGIFFDEAPTSRSGIAYCQALFRYTKRHLGPAHLVVLNPGVHTLEGLMDACDIMLNSESDWRTYRDAYPGNPDWVANYPPSRFWHVVHHCPTEAEMRVAWRLAHTRRAGWRYITRGTGANPYRALPTGRYWRSELRLAGQYAE